jgi:hypothetical protein
MKWWSVAWLKFKRVGEKRKGEEGKRKHKAQSGYRTLQIMGKKFKSKTCVYCGKLHSSRTGDHVFAREFFLPDKRNNLPQVPACERCNREKSELEHYLTAVLPFGGRHKDAYTNLRKMASRRLEKNLSLARQITYGRKNIWSKENSLFQLSMKIPFDFSKLSQLIIFIIKALMWHHWDILLTSESFIRAGCLKNEFELLFNNFFQGNAKQRVEVDLGNGTIEYEGAQGVDIHNQFSIWKFSVYGGVKLGDDPTAPSETSNFIWGLTSRKKNVADF